MPIRAGSTILILALVLGARSYSDARQGSRAIANRIVLVSHSAIPQNQINESAKLQPTEIASKFAELGYERVDRGDRVLMFSPELWQEQAFQGVATLYEELAASISPGGVLDPKDSPAVRRFVETAFGQGMRMDNATEAAMVVTPLIQLSITSGGQPIRMQLTHQLDQEVRQVLSTRPMKPKAPSTDLKEEAAAFDREFQQFQIKVFPSLHSAAFGFESNLASTRAGDLSEASRILAERFAELESRVREASLMIASKASGGNLEADKLEQGTPIDNLPEKLSSQISSFVIDNYKRLGFQTEDDARLYLSKAQVKSSSLLFTLTGMSDQGGSKSLISYGLPLP